MTSNSRRLIGRLKTWNDDRGFGFIEMPNKGEADKAISMLETHRALGNPGFAFADVPHVLGYAYLMRGDVPRARAAIHAPRAGRDVDDAHQPPPPRASGAEFRPRRG